VLYSINIFKGFIVENEDVLEFMSICEAYDADFMSGAQIRKTGEGGRIGTKRKKSESENVAE
jgi:hypothetical protein